MTILRDLKIPKESDEQINLMFWMSRYFGYYEYFHIPSENLLFSKIGKSFRITIIAFLKKLGFKSGLPDVWILRPAKGYRGMVVEMKRKVRSKTGTTQAQLDWIDNLNKQGWKATVAYGATDAIQQIAELYDIKWI